MGMVITPSNGIGYSTGAYSGINLDNKFNIEDCEAREQDAIYFVPEKKLDSIPKVLYVEDDDVARRAGLYFLQKMRCEVDTAINGREVLELYFAGQYDLILLDGGLPDITGFEVGKIIRHSEKPGQRVPLVLLSAYPQDVVQRECKAAGIDEYAIKPVKFWELQQMLGRWFELAGKTFDTPFTPR